MSQADRQNDASLPEGHHFQASALPSPKTLVSPSPSAHRTHAEPSSLSSRSTADSSSQTSVDIAHAGYSLPLVNSLVEKLTCGRCHLLLRNPYQLPCGDRICDGCLQQLLRSSSVPRCPLDGEAIRMEEAFKDNFARREILALSTRCPSVLVREGCQWVGKVADVEEHEVSCVFCDIKCTNEHCTATVLRSQLAEHLEKECLFRMVLCPYCSASVLANSLMNHQQDRCEGAPLPCPNKCTAPRMQRKMFKDHLAKCPLQVVGCYYAFAGCAFRGPRQDLPEHHGANMAYHLQLCSQGLQSVQSEVGTLKKQNVALNSRFSDLEQQFSAVSEQLEKKVASVVEQSTEKEAASASSSEGFESQNFDVLLKQQRNTDRTLAGCNVQLSDLNMRADLLEVKTCNGILVWKIADFSQRRREAMNAQTPSLYSPPFYTSPCGYKMCARLYPNGDGQGSTTHLSIFFVVMRGEYDALLPWPFQQRVTIKLLDQGTSTSLDNSRLDVVETFKPDPSSSSFHRPVKPMNVATGCPLFMSLADLKSKELRYIRDDTIFIKVIVQPVGSKAPDFLPK